MRSISLTVNGARHELEVEPRELLVYVLRDQLGLTGTNVGCDTSSCGACTVLLNGESVKSCTLLAVQADGQELTTIEGLATNGDLHPVQQAFHEQHGLQCGYCTPGMVMATVSLLAENPQPSEDEIRTRSRATSAAAPATTTSSRPCRPRRERRRIDGRHRDSRVHRRLGPAQGGPQAPDRPGPYVDNMTLPGMLWMALVRSPYAHARIVGVDVSAARGAPGVVAASPAADLADDWGRAAPVRLARHRGHQDAVALAARPGQGALRGRRRSPSSSPRAAPRPTDAAELVEVDYEPLPAVTDVAHALDEGAPLVHDDLPSNKCYVWSLDGGDVGKAFADAEVTVERALPPAAADPRARSSRAACSPSRCPRPAS